jgi:hypothetical protein
MSVDSFSWSKLRTRLKVDSPENYFGTDVWSEEMLRNFEKLSNIHLPRQYKTFMKFFGSTEFCQYVSILSPSLPHTTGWIRTLKIQIDLQLEDGNYFDREKMTDLVNSSYFFATTYGFSAPQKAELIMWDLRTHNKSDDCYDIYFVPVKKLQDVRFICRDFSEFISDFCLGTRLQSSIGLKKRYFPKIQGNCETYRQFSLPYLMTVPPR